MHRIGYILLLFLIRDISCENVSIFGHLHGHLIEGYSIKPPPPPGNAKGGTPMPMNVILQSRF